MAHQIDESKPKYLSQTRFMSGRRIIKTIYVALIVKGKRTYASVPAVLKEQVKEMLIDLELEDLITE